MACESCVEHLVGPLYFLQQTLFLRFSKISMSMAIYLYLRAGALACRGWLFLESVTGELLLFSVQNSKLTFTPTLD